MYEDTVDPILSMGHFGGVTIDLDIQAINPDSKSATVRFHPRFLALATPSTTRMGCSTSCAFAFAPLDIVDASVLFRGFGPYGANDSLLLLNLKPAEGSLRAVHEVLSDEAPTDVTTSLRLLGDPHMYPFDEYLLVGGVHDWAYLKDKHGINRDSTASSGLGPITLNVPGFTLQKATEEQLHGWDPFYYQNLFYLKPWPGEVNKVTTAKFYSGSEEVQNSRFALILKRPSFLKTLISVLGLVIVCGSIALAVLTPMRGLPQAFLTVTVSTWAIRSAISSGAPQTPTLVDYFTLGDYVLISLIVMVRLCLKHDRTNAKSGRSSVN
jgi:hypothetical protein